MTQSPIVEFHQEQLANLFSVFCEIKALLHFYVAVLGVIIPKDSHNQY